MTFDEETASIGGIQVKGLSFAFAVLTGMTVASAMPIVGVLLVSALIVLPAALALRLSRSFTAAILIAVVTGLIGIFSGLTTSYHLNTPPGGTIALILLVFLLIGISAQKLIGRYNRKRHRKERKQQRATLFIHSRENTPHEIQ